MKRMRLTSATGRSCMWYRPRAIHRPPKSSQVKSSQVKSSPLLASGAHSIPQISTTDRTHARTGPDKQRAQAHNHTQNSNPRTQPRRTSRPHAHTHTHLPPHPLSHPHARAHPPGEPSPARSPPTSPQAPPPAASPAEIWMLFSDLTDGYFYFACLASEIGVSPQIQNDHSKVFSEPEDFSDRPFLNVEKGSVLESTHKVPVRKSDYLSSSA